MPTPGRTADVDTIKPAALSAGQAARYIGVSESMLRKLVRQKRAPKPIHIGTCSRWLISDLDDYLRSLSTRQSQSCLASYVG